MRCSIIPPYLLERLASLEDERFATAAAAARASLELDAPFRGIRTGESPPPTTARRPSSLTARPLGDPERTISDAKNTQTLPGSVVRREGDPAAEDPAVNEAYDGLGDTHELYRAVYERASIDDNNLPLNATVHYGDDYDNAFWDGERMVFGDGDEVVFTRMTRSVSVIGHELTHGVTQYSANLEYQGQSGALNESVSDVFGVLVEQYAKKQSVTEATWLIGAGIFTDQVQGDALRSLKAPGTAYDDDVLGKDPQPAHMDGYVDTDDDNGGVHLNSGIPNHAFYLVADAIGGNAWERAGQIWYDALTGGSLTATADFAAFAEVTAKAAAARYGDDSDEHSAVIEGWDGVGITVSASRVSRAG
ncbi:M4 family metallopeptidase [Glaciihabitans sp. dw_435]|uniref:M4 family metallopeptidase n=1 Tax=Glaciihabitans sp. dw_435 TaxID=2720081 RepID=UPI001BD2F623|nr:M4 family metallopeptidase [Glaciihabitans sp. dw_435]